jgi:spore coat protein SA
MRLCLICTEKLPVPPVRGGAIQTYIDGVLPVLRANHDVTVVCRSDPALPDWAPGYVRLPAAAPEEYCRAAAQFLRWQEPFDRVVVYNRPAWVPVLTPAARGAGLLLSMHNDMFDSDRLPAETGRAVLAQVRAVVAISDYVRDRIAALYPESAQKLRTIRSGVDCDRFRPPAAGEQQALKQQLGLPEAAPVVLQVSRLSRRKGNDLLVAAMAQVRQRQPEARLLLVGSSRYGHNDLDPYGHEVIAKAQQLGDGFRFTGFVPPAEVDRFYRAADLFVCTSQWAEPLARVHYEAMASGLPIITTERGGNLEVMEEGGNGLIARPHDDPTALAEAIGRLVADSGLRAKLGARGRELALAHYRWERVGAELLQALEV